MPKAPHLRALREARMLSQVELGRRADVTPVTISRIETGQGAQYGTIRKLARALRVKPAALVGEPDAAASLRQPGLAGAARRYAARAREQGDAVETRRWKAVIADALNAPQTIP